MASGRIRNALVGLLKERSLFLPSFMKAQPFLTLIFIHTPHPRHQKTLFYLQNTSRISPLLPTSTAAALFPTPGLPHLGPHGPCPPPRASMLLPLLPSTCSQHSSSSCDNVSQIMRLPCLTPPMTPSRAVSKQTPLDCHKALPRMDSCDLATSVFLAVL